MAENTEIAWTDSTLVPREPTQEQVQIGVERWLQELENAQHGQETSINTRVAKIYRAMIEAIDSALKGEKP